MLFELDGSEFGADVRFAPCYPAYPQELAAAVRTNCRRSRSGGRGEYAAWPVQIGGEAAGDGTAVRPTFSAGNVSGAHHRVVHRLR